MNIVNLFNGCSNKQTECIELKKCKGYYIICDTTTPCFVETKQDYCEQHKPRYRFDKPDECPICYEEMGEIPIPLECGHWVHRECMTKSMKPICPICRKTIHIEDILYFMGKEFKDKMDKIEEISTPVQQTNTQRNVVNIEMFPDNNNRNNFITFLHTIISTINPVHIELIDTLRNIERCSQVLGPVDFFTLRLNIIMALPTELFNQFNWETTFLNNINQNTILNRYNSRIIGPTNQGYNIDNTVMRQRSWLGFIKHVFNSLFCTRFNI